MICSVQFACNPLPCTHRAGPWIWGAAGATATASHACPPHHARSGWGRGSVVQAGSAARSIGSECMRCAAHRRRCPECRGASRRPQINWGLVRVLGSLQAADQRRDVPQAAEVPPSAEQQPHSQAVGGQQQLRADQADQLVGVGLMGAAGQVPTHAAAARAHPSAVTLRRHRPATAAAAASTTDALAMGGSDAVAALQAELQGGHAMPMFWQGSGGINNGAGGSTMRQMSMPPEATAAADGGEAAEEQSWEVDDQQLVQHAMDELPITLQQVSGSATVCSAALLFCRQSWLAHFVACLLCTAGSQQLLGLGWSGAGSGVPAVPPGHHTRCVCTCVCVSPL